MPPVPLDSGNLLRASVKKIIKRSPVVHDIDLFDVFLFVHFHPRHCADDIFKFRFCHRRPCFSYAVNTIRFENKASSRALPFRSDFIKKIPALIPDRTVHLPLCLNASYRPSAEFSPYMVIKLKYLPDASKYVSFFHVHEMSSFLPDWILF